MSFSVERRHGAQSAEMMAAALWLAGCYNTVPDAKQQLHGHGVFVNQNGKLLSWQPDNSGQWVITDDAGEMGRDPSPPSSHPPLPTVENSLGFSLTRRALHQA